jgi:hypothetical protein
VQSSLIAASSDFAPADDASAVTTKSAILGMTFHKSRLEPAFSPSNKLDSW